MSEVVPTLEWAALEHQTEVLANQVIPNKHARSKAKQARTRCNGCMIWKVSGSREVQLSITSPNPSACSQDNHGSPRAERDLSQLNQYAKMLAGRTERFKSIGSQDAASRLLADQGFTSRYEVLTELNFTTALW